MSPKKSVNIRSLFLSLGAAATVLSAATYLNAADASMKPAVADLKAMTEKPAVTIGVVNFKRCVEESKYGKYQRQSFEGMRKEMESNLEKKEKKLQEIVRNFDNPDYVDGLSPEAETKAKAEYQSISQDIAQMQQQYYQMLSQVNQKALLSLADEVASSSREVAGMKGLSVVLNDEGCFYFAEPYDISQDVVKIMDQHFDAAPPKEEKANVTAPEATTTSTPAAPEKTETKNGK